MKRPDKISQEITKYTKNKLPHFFIYAKDKNTNQVEKANNSVVNRLKELIPNVRLNFVAAKLGKFDYTMLMRNKNITSDQRIINLYTELDLDKRFLDIVANDRDFTGDNIHVYKDIRKQLLELNSDVHYVADVLIEYLYSKKKSNFKTTLWSSFGDVIVENLKRNVTKNYGEKNIQCEGCFKRIEANSNSKKYCEECSKKIWREQVKINMREYRKRKQRYKNEKRCTT